jgi:trigger factor
LRELRQKTTPPIDDALAQKLGQESLGKLKTSLREHLQEEFDMGNEARKQKLVVDAIVKNASIDLPETMIEREQKLLLNQLKHYLESNRQSFEDFEKSPEFEKIKEAKYDEAKQRVLTSLVLGEIIKTEKVTFTEEELESHLQDFIDRHGLSEDKVINNENILRQSQEELLTAKVLELLLQNVQINYTPEPVLEPKNEKNEL